MAQQANQPLPNGHLLEEYTIDRQLSLGGFSIVYQATDTAGRQVAIKEYLPNSLALRTRGDVTPLISAEHLGAFRYGICLLYTSPSPRDRTRSRMPSSA